MDIPEWKGLDMRKESLQWLRMCSAVLHVLLCGILLSGIREARADMNRILSGVVITDKNEAVTGVPVIVRSSSGQQTEVSDYNGQFRY